MNNAKPQHQPDDAFIVVGHDEKGRLSPSKNPVAHLTEASARAEATRLAQATPGYSFAVFALVGVAVVEQPKAFRPTRWRETQEIPF
jgi:hypothetical protein